MKKCDICGKEFENSGIILEKKKDGLDLLLCPDCAGRACREMWHLALELEGVKCDEVH